MDLDEEEASERRDGVKAGVVDMADRHVVEELRGTSAPRR
jgi:hypothetical protein